MAHNSQKNNLRIADGVPVSTTNALYNNAGTLYFNGSALAAGATIAVGTVTDNTLRWSGAAWVETALFKVGATQITGILTNSAADIIFALAPPSGASTGSLGLQFIDSNLFSALDFNTSSASVSSNDGTAANTIIFTGGQDITLNSDDGVNNATLTITSTQVLVPNIISSSYARVGTTSDTTAGNIRYTGTHFEGRVGAAWKRFDSIPDGTVTNSTIRWNGTEWVEAANMKNDGTSTITSTFVSTGITIGTTAANKDIIIINNSGVASTGQTAVTYTDDGHTAQLQFSATNANLRSQNPAATQYHEWSFAGSGTSNTLRAVNTTTTKQSGITFDVSSNAGFNLRNTHGNITKYLTSDQTAANLKLGYTDVTVGGFTAALEFNVSNKILLMTNSTTDGEVIIGCNGTSTVGQTEIFYSNSSLTSILALAPSGYNHQHIKTVGANQGTGQIIYDQTAMNLTVNQTTGTVKLQQLDFAANGNIVLTSSIRPINIGSANATLNAVTNSVVVGGNITMTASKSNTVYTPGGKSDNIKTVTSTPYTTLNSDYEVLMNVAGATAVTLIATPEVGRRVKIKNINATGVVTITPTSGTIDGAATYIIPVQYSAVELQSDGTNWFATNKFNANIVNTSNGTIQFNSGIINKARVVTGADATLLATDYYLKMITSGSNRIVNLIASPEVGRTYIIKREGTNQVTLTPAAGNIEGAATYSVTPNGGAVTIIYNGTQWDVI